MNNARILVTGPQGSGKTTQAKLLAEFLGVQFIGTGDLVRDRAKVDDDVGQNIKEALAKGQLADNKTVSDLIREKVDGSGFVMDGYPRDEEQLELFDPEYNKVFYLNISDEEVMDRLLKRGRADDTLDLIKERLRVYHLETEPLLKRYKDQEILEIIDGSATIEEIQGRMRELLNG